MMWKDFFQCAICAMLLCFLVACGQKQQPRSALDFENDRAGLDAKLVACFEDRRMNVTDPECKNARAAAAKIERSKRAQSDQRHRKESEQRLDAVRREREAKDAVARQRLQAVIDRAESKVALGQALSAEEARALGLDPENSVLSEGADDLPAIPRPNAAQQSVRPVEQVREQSRSLQATDDKQPASLSEIRESLKEKSNGD